MKLRVPRFGSLDPKELPPNNILRLVKPKSFTLPLAQAGFSASPNQASRAPAFASTLDCDSEWPHSPGRKTFAYDIARGNAERGSDNVYVDEWFSGAVERHTVHEDSRRLGDDLVLSILWWTDEGPLAEIVERDE